MDLWQSQTEDHTSDWLMVVLISGLGQTLTYRRVLCYRSGISAGKEVDIRLGSSPLTQTGMVDFVADHAVTDAAHHSAMPFNNEDVLKVISLNGEKYGSDVHANMAGNGTLAKI
nr:hypothetical protein [Tanacetum cinerariifolium]